MSTAEQRLAALEARGARNNPWRAGRSCARADNGMVATSHPLATLAGVDLLRAGGSAMDAAIGAAAVLAVVEPMMTGPGGDAFLLYWHQQERRVYGLNGSGRAAAAVDPDAVRVAERAIAAEGAIVAEDARVAKGTNVTKGTTIATNSWNAVTVPGAVDAWQQASDRFGRLGLEACLAPAIGYAENGFAVSEVVQAAWESHAADLVADDAARRCYLVNGLAPKLGEVFHSPLLAATLRTISKGGADAFYRGPLAEEVVRYARLHGSVLSLDDFANHSSTWVEPLSTLYRGWQVMQIPPNGQGVAVLEMLNLAAGFDLKAAGYGTAEVIHRLIEAKKIAYADLERWLADPEHSTVPAAAMAAMDWADRRRADVGERAANPVAPTQDFGTDTVYLTVADRDGNAVSFINSLFDAFGAKVVGGDTGMLLHNRGCGFSLVPGHPNEIGPGKRPFHTIIPGMVIEDGDLRLSFGVMGGSFQPQGHVQLLTGLRDFGLGLQEAIDVPRWRHTEGLEVLLEHGTPAAVRTALTERGHQVRPAGGHHFGGAQAILRDEVTGTWVGASDPRKDGIALGY